MRFRWAKRTARARQASECFPRNARTYVPLFLAPWKRRFLQRLGTGFRYMIIPASRGNDDRDASDAVDGTSEQRQSRGAGIANASDIYGNGCRVLSHLGC